MPFKDRIDAGKKLAEQLKEFANKPVVVFALPRGGVVLGKEVAQSLHAPLDLLIPRKIGHPDNPEYAIASVTETGDVVRQEEEVASVNADWFKDEVEHQRQEAARRRKRYLSHRKVVEVKNKIAIIVDDGIATGLTMKAAIADLKSRDPLSIIVAVPVAPRDTVQELKPLVDRVIVLEQPFMFMGAIGAYYDTFEQVDDEEVVMLMSK